MRSPVIAFSIFAAAAVSPALVGAAPTSPNISKVGDIASKQHLPAGSAPHVPAMVTREFGDKDFGDKEFGEKHHKHKHDRRVEDYRTAGGNAYSGGSGTVSGGDVINDADRNDNTITNTGPATSKSVLRA